MTTYDAIKYNKTFISQVICRVDFLNYIKNEEIFDQIIIDKITEFFPKKEMEQVIKFNTIKIEGDSSPASANIHGSSIEGLQNTFTNREGTNKIILSNKFLIFDYKQYDTFETLLDCFSSVIKNIEATLEKFSSLRIGLRYINVMSTDKLKIQKGFFCPNVAYATSNNIVELDVQFKLIRSMQTAEYRVDNMMLNFRFGLYNPNYPSKVIKKDFILDYDCFIQEIISNSNEIIEYIKRGHNSIQIMFESSITSKLRAVMNDG